MAFFQDNPEDWKRLDCRILQNGWASLYWQQPALENDLNWFKEQNFEIVYFDCSQWRNTQILHNDFRTRFHFPDYYGENLNALNDCLSELEINDSGLVIVFYHFQSVKPKLAHTLLDIFANHSRRYMLVGKKLLTLVQVDNPKYRIDNIGSCPVLWRN